jgi:hypothetical protein
VGGVIRWDGEHTFPTLLEPPLQHPSQLGGRAVVEPQLALCLAILDFIQIFQKQKVTFFFNTQA